MDLTTIDKIYSKDMQIIEKIRTRFQISKNKGLPNKIILFKYIILIRRHQYITDNIDPSFQVTLHEFLFR